MPSRAFFFSFFFSFAKKDETYSEKKDNKEWNNCPAACSWTSKCRAFGQLFLSFLLVLLQSSRTVVPLAMQGEGLCPKKALRAFSFLAKLKKTRLASSFFALQKRKKRGGRQGRTTVLLNSYGVRQDKQVSSFLLVLLLLFYRETR
jgi:hypothetical protein